MTNAPAPTTVDMLPMNTLKQRIFQAKRVLRDARRHVAAVGGLEQLDAALDATEVLLPGLLERPQGCAPPLATVRRLRHADRVALKAALLRGGAIARHLQRELADVAPRAILEAIERIELYDDVSIEVLALLRTLEVGTKAAC